MYEVRKHPKEEQMKGPEGRAEIVKPKVETFQTLQQELKNMLARGEVKGEESQEFLENFTGQIKKLIEAKQWEGVTGKKTVNFAVEQINQLKFDAKEDIKKKLSELQSGLKMLAEGEEEEFTRESDIERMTGGYKSIETAGLEKTNENKPIEDQPEREKNRELIESDIDTLKSLIREEDLDEKLVKKLFSVMDKYDEIKSGKPTIEELKKIKMQLELLAPKAELATGWFEEGTRGRTHEVRDRNRVKKEAEEYESTAKINKKLNSKERNALAEITEYYSSLTDKQKKGAENRKKIQEHIAGLAQRDGTALAGNLLDSLVAGNVLDAQDIEGAQEADFFEQGAKISKKGEIAEEQAVEVAGIQKEAEEYHKAVREKKEAYQEAVKAKKRTKSTEREVTAKLKGQGIAFGQRPSRGGEAPGSMEEALQNQAIKEEEKAQPAKGFGEFVRGLFRRKNKGERGKNERAA